MNTLRKESDSLYTKELPFESKRIFVTGGASGIGFALAQYFQQNGAEVIAIDIQNSDKPHEFMLKEADVSELKSLQSTLPEDPLDILIIAAGMTSVTDDPTTDEMDTMDGVNVRGVENTLAIYANQLSPDAQVVFIGSDAPPKEYYAKTKAEGAELVRQFSKEHPDIDVRVIKLGPVDTPLFRTGKSQETILRIAKNVGLFEPIELAEQLSAQLIDSKAGFHETVLYKEIEG